MARGLITGIGAAGAVAAAVTGGIYFNGARTAPAPESLSALGASADPICIKSNVRLVDGMTQACLSSAQYEALRDRDVLGGDGRSVDINLAGPSDGGDDAVARNCAEYDGLIAKGWYALTGADMRREEYFKRACGALTLLAAAKPAELTHFSDGKATRDDILSMASVEATGFGEAAPSTDVDVAEIETGVWKVVIGQGEMMVYEIAHADFTGDDLGEILSYVSVGAGGGTARTGSIGFLEKNADDAPCTFSAR